MPCEPQRPRRSHLGDVEVVCQRLNGPTRSPSPGGRGLERLRAQRSGLRQRVKGWRCRRREPPDWRGLRRAAAPHPFGWRLPRLKAGVAEPQARRRIVYDPPPPAGRGSTNDDLQHPQHPRPIADRVVDPPGLAQRRVLGEPDPGPAERPGVRLAQVIAQHDVVAPKSSPVGGGGSVAKRRRRRGLDPDGSSAAGPLHRFAVPLPRRGRIG